MSTEENKALTRRWYERYNMGKTVALAGEDYNE